MRIDHIAYRTKDRKKTAQFFIDALGYTIQQEFKINFDDGTIAQCIALEPPEKKENKFNIPCPWATHTVQHKDVDGKMKERLQEYHLPPEIFVSDGPIGSIVGDWVEARGGIGGIHHIAYQVDSVADTMAEWKAKGYAEFSSTEPLKCPEDGLVQIFTKPIEIIGGIIYEFIERGEFGFCADNVKHLMESTKGL